MELVQKLQRGKADLLNSLLIDGKNWSIIGQKTSGNC